MIPLRLVLLRDLTMYPECTDRRNRFCLCKYWQKSLIIF